MEKYVKTYLIAADLFYSLYIHFNGVISSLAAQIDTWYYIAGFKA